jgi:hypothetical protein
LDHDTGSDVRRELRTNETVDQTKSRNIQNGASGKNGNQGVSVSKPQVKKSRKIVPVESHEYRGLVNTFGVTKNYEVAGYLLGNGLMLDFSGKHWGDDYSTSRQVDHRDVLEGLGYDSPHAEGDGVGAMIDMIGSGNIRLMPDGSFFRFEETKKNAAREPSQGVTFSGSLAETTSATFKCSIWEINFSVKTK